jgi:uncharacterized damage-inducible protein DinB
MTALTAEELIAWVEHTTTGWRSLTANHPEILAFSCDVRESSSIAELLQHIVAVELRYAQRLNGIPETSYDQIGLNPTQDLFPAHDQAITLLRQALSDSHTDWEQEIDFATRSAGTLHATRRTVLVHLLMHSIRHYAQLATLVRQHGIQPGWPMDFLFMSARKG